MLKNILAAVGVGYICHCIYEQGRKRGIKALTLEELEAMAEAKRGRRTSKPAEAPAS